MKISNYLALGWLVISLTPVFGQPAPAPGGVPAQNFQTRLQEIVKNAGSPQTERPVLTRFNLDFPGGVPEELVKAVEKATGTPLNAIIPNEDAEVQLPPLKMNDVVVPQLFAALEAASRKTVAVAAGGGYSQQTTDYGFQTSDSPLTDGSIWYFHAEKPVLPPMVSIEKTCRFYSLETYLNRGFTVDDITTAIQTGWKMSGVPLPPDLNYHKETRLLIAFGAPDDLHTIEQVLNTLPAQKAIQAQDDLNSLKVQIGMLQKEIDNLNKKLSDRSPAPVASPEEKSGK